MGPRIPDTAPLWVGLAIIVLLWVLGVRCG